MCVTDTFFDVLLYYSDETKIAEGTFSWKNCKVASKKNHFFLTEKYAINIHFRIDIDF